MLPSVKARGCRRSRSFGPVLYQPTTFSLAASGERGGRGRELRKQNTGERRVGFEKRLGSGGRCGREGARTVDLRDMPDTSSPGNESREPDARVVLVLLEGHW